MKETTNFRENLPYYIASTKSDQEAMLKVVGATSLSSLYSHIKDGDKFKKPMGLPSPLPYDKIKDKMKELSNKNKKVTSFLGGGLQNYKVESIVPYVSNIRGLTTAYTPYQPERSQGTLRTLWIYQSLLSEITGFEAINASMYERSTCLFEAINTAIRIVKNSTTVIVPESLHPKDKLVLDTHAIETETKIIYVKINNETSKIDQNHLEEILTTHSNIAGLVIPQINSFGVIEDVDHLTTFIHEKNLLAIALIDPMALGNESLKEPGSWGINNEGADILVGEGQHLVIAPTFGGPGLGIFGIRYNEKNKNNIRQTAGRFIGKTVDSKGREALSIILSTREQHIRREKANSNICSNQSFIASACGASLLQKGSLGLTKASETARLNAYKTLEKLLGYEGIELKFNSPFFNEFTLKLNQNVDALIKKGSDKNLHIGINVSKHLKANENLLLVSLSDKHTDLEMNALVSFFEENFKKDSKKNSLPSFDSVSKRKNKITFPSFSFDELSKFYSELGEQNLSPDDGIYPLGSCTMKYNPEINDWAANLEGFTSSHPEAPLYDNQGSLEVLYEIQEWFKKITGLPHLTTEPLAGAQGELVGLKMIQAYHRDHSQHKRDIIIIPRSAHGTNPATASMAGFSSENIIILNANEVGEIDLSHLKEILETYKERISCIMVTNPNTSGIFETNFSTMSKMIHDIGGLVYMDGANMNAIAGWLDLSALGVDAVHNNLHKTWSIPHGGGGPGDAIVATSELLKDYLPGVVIEKNNGTFVATKAKKSIGSFHRHFGNFGHKVRALTYLLALGEEGVKEMSSVAVLSARYLYSKLKEFYPTLPEGSETNPRMHEFILTLEKETFNNVELNGTPKAQTIAKVGKLFLDFGLHAPTVAFPEVFGLMIEPTESYSKKELDRFFGVVKTIKDIVHEMPEVLQTVPHFTPVSKVDEVKANKDIILSEKIERLPTVLKDRFDAKLLREMDFSKLKEEILFAHRSNL